MPIKGMWYHYRMECIEVFLSRAFTVAHEYALALMQPRTESDYDHAGDILTGYQDIVFRAVYAELNALVERELRHLARAIQEAEGSQPSRLSRGTSRQIIEKHYNLRLSDLAGHDGVAEIRRITNAYKHDDGLSGSYEEVFSGQGDFTGYKETRYKLDYDRAFDSIQAVREFARALPGEREEFPEARSKPEDAATRQARDRTWQLARQSGVLGHELGELIEADDADREIVAKCLLCGKSFRGEDERAVFVSALLDRESCPGIPKAP